MRKNIFTLIIISLIIALCAGSVYPAGNNNNDNDNSDCTGYIASFIALGILAGTFYFFAWCWRAFKTILLFIFRPVKKLLGLQGVHKSLYSQAIINAPKINLKPIEQYYKLDPEFDGEGIKSLTANLYVQLQDSIQAKDISSLRPYMTNEFYSQVDRQIDSLRKQHKTAYTENIAVLGVTLKGWRQAAGMDYITLGLNSRIISYVLDDITGKLLSGDRTREKFIEYEIDLSRKRGIITAHKSNLIQAKTCPNCGAPVDLNASAKCQYCGTVINQVNIDWAVCAIIELELSERNS